MILANPANMKIIQEDFFKEVAHDWTDFPDWDDR